MLNAAIIVAAGSGRRMGSPLPKQYLPLAGRTVLTRTLEAFLASNAVHALRVVINPDDRDLYDEAVEGLAGPRLGEPIAGGATRAASVRLGLEAMADAPPDRVLIHDAARPFVTPGLIADVLDGLEQAEGAFLALPVVDALWSARDGHAGQSVPREGLWRAQTPQGFRYDAIRDAHRTGHGDAADDVAVARAAGLRVRIVIGDESNFKITTPADLARAESLLSKGR